MLNPVHPDQMTSAERLAELGALLAAGLIRLLPPKSSEELPLPGESLLDFSAKQSGGGPNQQRKWSYVR
jgi:hypothetical protein